MGCLCVCCVAIAGTLPNKEEVMVLPYVDGEENSHKPEVRENSSKQAEVVPPIGATQAAVLMACLGK